MKDDAGFTLLETLVSIALLALIAAFLPGLMQLGTRALQSRSELDAISSAGPARKFISQRLETAAAELHRRGDGRLQLAFEGRRDGVSFAAPASLGESRSGLQEYEFRFGQNTGAPGGELWAVVRPFTFEGNAPSERSVLLRNVASVSFRYFGARRGDERATWHDQWIGEPELPELVELTSTFSAPQPAGERPLIVALKLARAR